MVKSVLHLPLAGGGVGGGSLEGALGGLEASGYSQYFLS